jgi:hypothetical protein
MDISENNNNKESWKTKSLLLGAVIGMLTGLGGAYLLIQNAEKHGTRVELSTGEGLKLSMLVIGLLRQISRLMEGD